MPTSRLQYSEKTVIWGIRIAPLWKRRWQNLALMLGIPVNRLINIALKEWVDSHAQQITDKAALHNLGNLMAAAEVEIPPSLQLEPQESDNPILDAALVNLSIRGVKASTQIKLRSLAIISQQPVYSVMDKLVAKAWDEVKDKPLKEGMTSRLKRVIDRSFRRISRNP